MSLSSFLSPFISVMRQSEAAEKGLPHHDMNKEIPYSGWFSIVSSIYVSNMNEIDAFNIDDSGNTFHELRVSAALREEMSRRCGKDIPEDVFLHMCHQASFSSNAITFIAEQCHNLETNVE